MPAINTVKYLSIANLYDQAREALVGISDYYYQAAYEIVQLDYFDPELDLLRPFYDAYNASLLIYQTTPVGIIQAVAALQAHVLSKARTDPTKGTGLEVTFANINEWLEAATATGGVGRKDDSNDAAIQVPSNFADMSAEAGYSIDPGNIA